MALSVPESYFIALFCEAIMHGLYTVIFIGAMFILTRKGRRTRSWTQKCLIGLTVLMYCISTVHISLALRQSVLGIFEENAASGGLTTFNNPASPLLLGQFSLELFNFLIGDSIVTWRAWVLWGGGWVVLVVPSILLVAGAVTGSLLVHAYATSPITDVMFGTATTTWLEVFGSVTFAINFYAICIIGHRAWKHEREMRTAFTSAGRAFCALLVIIESGAVYCVALLIIVVLIATDNNGGIIVMVDILAHLTGIYPSVILILVSLQMTYTDTMRRDKFAGTSFNSGGPDRSSHRTQSVPGATYPMAPVVHVKMGDTYKSRNSDLIVGFDPKSEGPLMV